MLRSCVSVLAGCSRSGSAPWSRRASSLAEFFDDEANFSAGELRANRRPGRPWTAEELRLKSNSDLHKLWFVCLKERNMLLTMKKALNERARTMPNADRIDKVDETMTAIKEVIDERDDAVLRLETGMGARPPERAVTSFMGFTYKQEAKEHINPPGVDSPKEYEVPMLDGDAQMMQKLWAEKEHMKALEKQDEEVRRKLQTPEMRKFRRGGPRTFNKTIPYEKF